MSPEPSSSANNVLFLDLELNDALLRALNDVGYESATPIQAATIPPLLAGRDVLGQAQTGTGKTAAFALPILSRLDLSRNQPQALVLAPTRELAIQVAEAFQRYAAHLPGFRVLPIYGGQSYQPQLQGLKRGSHVVVGTPGRVIDHLNRGSLDLSGLTTLVLDEGDEMLRMGFIDDVEAVLAKTPPERQIALFSATMPAPIRRIAQKHLRNPAEITITAKTTTATNIRQRYWWVSGMHKLEGLTRILEVEPFDAMLVFSRTKLGTEELAGKLQARGFAAAAINGDVVQAQRERMIQQLKDGRIDILVATDVAARGLDVERISHVLNYDIPHDTESYVHRVGRTGRAGRSGEAILFVTPREKHLLRAIERATRQPITEMQLPSVESVNDQRITRFKQRIGEALEASDLQVFRSIIEQYENENDVPVVEIAAALARLAQGDKPLLLDASKKPEHVTERRPDRAPASTRDAGWAERTGKAEKAARPPRPIRASAASDEKGKHPSARDEPHHAPRDVRSASSRPHDAPRTASSHREADAGLETFRVEVGHTHGVKPNNLVGAIANEAGLDSKYIGRITIQDDHSLIDLPEGMPVELLGHLKKVWVSGQRLRISRLAAKHSPGSRGPRADSPDTGKHKSHAGEDAPKKKHAPPSRRKP